jgi:hypothetical protein
VGPRELKNGQVELKRRATDERSVLPLDDAVAALVDARPRRD